jgi:hypothetical protein
MDGDLADMDAEAERNYSDDDDNWDHHSKFECCERSVDDPGCMGARHIDDKIPGEAARKKSMKKAAVERAARITYWQCRDCHHDFKICKGTKIPKDYTCKPCQTRRKIREIVHKCKYCGDDFSIDRDYLGFDLKKPVCDECQYVLESRKREWEEDEDVAVCLCHRCGDELGPVENDYPEDEEAAVCDECYKEFLERSKGGN